MPWGGAKGKGKGKMHNRSNLGTFYAKKKCRMLLTPRPSLQCCARIATGSIPGVVLGVKIYNIDIYVRISFGSHNLGTFCARKLKSGLLLTQTEACAKLLGVQRAG